MSKLRCYKFSGDEHDNQGGQFSSEERSAAQGIMSQQQVAAMQAADKSGDDYLIQVTAAIRFLDGVSEEEKGSLRWAQERGTAQAGYEMAMQAWGKEPEDLGTGSPIIDLFVKAYRELSAEGNFGLDPRDMPSWKKAIELWDLYNETAPSLPWSL